MFHFQKDKHPVMESVAMVMLIISDWHTICIHFLARLVYISKILPQQLQK